MLCLTDTSLCIYIFQCYIVDRDICTSTIQIKTVLYVHDKNAYGTRHNIIIRTLPSILSTSMLPLYTKKCNVQRTNHR